jgi:glycosyltransferase involved in cell wall biosynthesis
MNASDTVAVIWIDWYTYHVARFRALAEHPLLRGRVAGIELVGGSGVHRGMLFRDAKRADLPVTTLKPSSSWAEAGQTRLALAIWKKLNQLKPTVVLVPGYYTAPAITAALWTKLRGRKTILMTETTAYDDVRVAWKESVKKHVLRLFDWAVAGGAPHVRYLEALGFPSSRIAHSYDVVDNSFFKERTRKLRESSSPQEFALPSKYFLYVGRLAPEKNIGRLIEAYAYYRRAGGTWELVLAGEGPLRPELQAQARQCGLAHTIGFAGLRSTDELAPYYAFAGCFVLPSIKEPWGLVVNEAMASSLPVIVSNRCGCAEDLVSEGENGFLFDPEDSGELAGCLIRLANLSENDRRAAGIRSHEIISNYSLESWASEVARAVGPPSTEARAGGKSE